MLFFCLKIVLQVENSQLRSDLERLRQAVAGGDGENNAVRELTGRRRFLGMLASHIEGCHGWCYEGYMQLRMRMLRTPEKISEVGVWWEKFRRASLGFLGNLVGWEHLLSLLQQPEPCNIMTQ